MNSSSLFLVFGLVAIATGLSCYEGEEHGATVVSSEEYLMCKMEKDVNGEKKVYSGTAEVHDLTRGTCLLIVGHIGALINNGLLFKYVEVPKWAVLAPNGPVSAEHCHMIRTRNECAQVEGNCTLARRSACLHKTVLTQGGTYVEAIHDSNFIATTEKSYKIYYGLEETLSSRRRKLPNQSPKLMDRPNRTNQDPRPSQPFLC
ncbi:hypothetical protein CAEBREN_01192 [Caenorhabditis brenneri]|uniref:Uncharacterized protein n=1 Tax=Caenorhabditis brenneri TaxID=135651 RepID=G0MU81_CAEBE|nr:hypothetical protein CAEBREN_01192 [Caenorhabditis brenneri]